MSISRQTHYSEAGRLCPAFSPQILEYFLGGIPMSKNAALKQRTAYLSIISNTTLVVLKLIVGIYVGAVSLISEALHSGVDLIAALIAFWAVRKSVTPPDMEHDYGHGKYENLSAAVEAVSS